MLLESVELHAFESSYSHLLISLDVKNYTCGGGPGIAKQNPKKKNWSTSGLIVLDELLWRSWVGLPD